MKVAMIINIIPDFPSEKLNLKKTPVGGWLMAMVEELLRINPNLSIDLISDYKTSCNFKGNRLSYFLFPISDKNVFQDYLSEQKPDVLHVNGTEFLKTDSIYDLNHDVPIVTSIQGLVSEYAKYIYASIDESEIFKNLTLRDILKQDSLFHMKKDFEKRGISEQRKLKKSDLIVGRTSWDFAFTQKIEQSHKYRHCFENLRNSFYTSRKWSDISCTPCTIFCSQASAAYKGLHILIKALPTILQYFPDTTVRIAGHNLFSDRSIVDRLKRLGYGAYLKRLVKRLGVEKNVVFTGLLMENEMVEEYLNAQIFVQTSFIENSPNSLGEAILLGVPIIATDVGGTKDFVEHGKNAFLYNCNDDLILAHHIIELLKNKELRDKFSLNSLDRADEFYNRNNNAKTMNNIYLEAGLIKKCS